MFNLESKAVRHFAKLQGYEVFIETEDLFIEFKNTSFGMLYYPKHQEWEVFTNYTKDGKWKSLRNSFNGSYEQCTNKIIQLDKYFKSKTR